MSVSATPVYSANQRRVLEAMGLTPMRLNAATGAAGRAAQVDTVRLRFEQGPDDPDALFESVMKWIPRSAAGDGWADLPCPPGMIAAESLSSPSLRGSVALRATLWAAIRSCRRQQGCGPGPEQ